MPHAFIQKHLSDGCLPGDNPGLVLQRLAPSLKADAHQRFVQVLACTKLPGTYEAAFRRWQRRTPPGDEAHRRVLRFECSSPLIVGMGEPAPGENGLTTLYPYGVPMIPGSALKGVTRARCRDRFADDTQWGETGSAFQELFGTGGHLGRAGAVDFLDAWIEPSGRFVADVLTVHHARYYRGEDSPKGWEDPNPVHFTAVEGHFRVVIEGPGTWLDRAEELLIHALKLEGVGAKTRSGYGRLEACGLDAADLDAPIQMARQKALEVQLAKPALERLQAILETYGPHDTPLAQALEAVVLGRLLKGNFSELQPGPQCLLDPSTADVQAALAAHLRPSLRKRVQKRGSASAQEVLDVLDGWVPASVATPGAIPVQRNARRLSKADLTLTKKERVSVKHLRKKVLGLEKRLCAGDYPLEDVVNALEALEGWGAKPGTLAAIRAAHPMEK